MPVTVILWTLLGLLAGGLLNHLADRLPVARRVSQGDTQGHLPRHAKLLPPPSCPHCTATYRRRQWLATVAILNGAGHCRECGQALPPRRWLLDLGLAAAYGILAWRYPPGWTLVAATFHASVLLLVTVTDLEHRIVPDAAVLPAMVVTVLLAVVRGPRGLPGILLGGGLAFLLFLFLARIYPGAMGLGDVKLAGYVGLIAGYPRVLVYLFVAVLAGGVGAAVLLISGKGTRRSYIPYAPYLALGGGLALLFL